MAMTNPTILQLLDKVDCRYTLVVEVSKRARQLVGGAQPLIDIQGDEGRFHLDRRGQPRADRL